jgi:hypothetical protein
VFGLASAIHVLAAVTDTLTFGSLGVVVSDP